MPRSTPKPLAFAAAGTVGLATALVAPPAAPTLVLAGYPLDAAATAPVAQLAYELSAHSFGSLARYEHPASEREAAARTFLEGPFGRQGWLGWPRAFSLAPSTLTTADDIAIAHSFAPPLTLSTLPLWPRPESGDALTHPLPAMRASKMCLARPVDIVRYGGEAERFALTTCAGAIAADALDKLSSIGRPVDTPRPELPLPEAPAADAPAGEWIEGVRLVEPRLIWLLQTVASTFPRHAIYVVSGYRRGHRTGLHGLGRALDLYVDGVPNEQVYAACRKLRDVGCGFYPNAMFVHIDARPSGWPKAHWVDVAAAGEPSHYVDGWPGVEPALGRATEGGH